jgi:hypothetical protein
LPQNNETRRLGYRNPANTRVPENPARSLEASRCLAGEESVTGLSKPAQK